MPTLTVEKNQISPKGGGELSGRYLQLSATVVNWKETGTKFTHCPVDATQKGRNIMKEFSDIKRIVVKIGSSSLTHSGGGINFRKIDRIAMVLSDIKNMGKEVILVTSGAVGAGMAKLGMRERPRIMEEKQAAASVGQCELMFIYDKYFSEYGQTIAQLLLHKDVTTQENLRENAQNTLETLLRYGAIPVINENDSIAVDEIAYGDNDTLSAITANLVDADLLVLLTDIDGLYTANPADHPDATLIERVEGFDPALYDIAGGSGSKVGTGGMVTKLHAVEIAFEKQIPVALCNGADPAILYDVLSGDFTGTLFVPTEKEGE